MKNMEKISSLSLTLKSMGNMSPSALELYQANGIGALLDIVVIPWGHVYRNYLTPLFRFN